MLFQELGKLKRSSIMTSIILVAVGVLMILCPKQYVNALVSTLGYGMLIFGVVMILDFISGKKALMNYVYLTGALILALVGIAIVVFEVDVQAYRIRVTPLATNSYARHSRSSRRDRSHATMAIWSLAQ